MRRSAIAVIALLVLLTVAASVVAWRLSATRRALVIPTVAPTAAATATPAPTTSPSPAPIVTATAALSPHLTAALDPALDPANHPPYAPITLIFDRPVDTSSTLQPLVIWPGTAGKFRWNEENTAVTFTPATYFISNTKYRLTADAALRGIDGATFDEPPVWPLSVAQQPLVLSRTPTASSGSDRRQAFVLNFDREMDHESVAAAFSVEPAIPLDLSWDETKLTIRPIELFDPGVAYNFTLASDAADSGGMRMIDTYSFRYTLPPVITRVEGPTRTEPDTPFFIRFGYPMDWDATVPALLIDPPIDAEIRPLGDQTLQLIDPPLLGNQDYTFSLSAPARDANGDPLPIPDKPVVYSAPSPILAFSPSGDNAHPAAVLRIKFDRPMDPTTTAGALSISPQVPGEIAWEDDSALLFTPTGSFWQSKTQYVVTMGTGATSADGHPILGKPQIHKFTTGDDRRIADWGIGPQTQVVDADGRRAVQFQVNLEDPVSIKFDLLPLDQAGFLNRIVGNVISGWYEPAEPIADNGLSPITSWMTWTTPRPSERWGNAQETLIPDDAPPGLYLLRMNGPEPANLLLALSRMTLAAKLSADEIVVWLTNIDSRGASGADITQLDSTEGGPISGAAIQVYARNGRLLAEATTDSDGVARLALPPDAEPYIVFARNNAGDSAVGDDITFSALTPEMQAIEPYYIWPDDSSVSLTPPAFAVHVQTDRPIYRPGQTAFYKAILRFDDDGVVSLPPVGTQAIVRLRDARDNIVLTRWLATDEFGAVYDSFHLAEGAMLGDYAVEVTPVGPSNKVDVPTRQVFQVEEYRKPDFSVTLSTDTPEVLADGTVTVIVSADYLFGEPVAGAEVEFKTYYFMGYNDYFGTGSWDRDSRKTWHGITDAQGRLVFSLPVGELLADYRNPYDARRLAIEATVNDGSNQTVSAMTAVVVYSAAEAITLRMPGYFVESGDEVSFTAAVTTTLGDPLPVAGRTLRGTLSVWSNTTQEYDQVVAESQWGTGPDGVISAYLTPPGPGFYRLQLGGIDDGGHAFSAQRYVYVLGEGEHNWWRNRGARISVSADRDSYAPGDVAQLLIETQFAGPALITFERATVFREMPVMLTPPVTVVEVPILPEDAPNIFATVNVWKPLTTLPPNSDDGNYWLLERSQPDAELQQSTVELNVPVTDRTLTVTIETDRDVYAPRDNAAVTVRVADANGQPVRAQVALAMIDEAIFLLADDNTQPLHDAFYGHRLNRVVNRNALSPGRYLYDLGGYGGGGEYLGQNLRSDFLDTAAWFPALVTDENGEATIVIPLADNLTTWRLTARAITASDTSVGEAIHTLITHQEIIVRPLLPRGLTAGDEVVLSAIVHNYGDEPEELNVSLSDEAKLLAIAGPVTQAVTLEPGAMRIVSWPAEVAAGETAVLVVAAGAGGEGDAVKLPLVVREMAVPAFEYATGHIEESGRIMVNLPNDALPSSAVMLEISRSSAGALFNGLEYLIGFPYGCVEQTMSRALPNAVVSRAFHQLGIPEPTSLNLDRLVNESAQKLYGFQRDDGGWGWWFDDDSDSYQTAWVLFGLATMVEAGHEIDRGVIERGAAFLRRQLASDDPRTRAYALYSLAVAGELDETSAAAALALLAQVEADPDPRLLEPFSLAALALTLDVAGEGEAAQTAMDRLATQVHVSGDKAYWLPSGDGRYDRQTMASSVRSTALALSAFIRLRPGDELEPLIVNYLMGERRGNGWGTTNETAYAIIGLTDYLLHMGVGQTTAAYEVTLNGMPLTIGTLDKSELRDVIEIPFDQLRPGANVAVLTATDGGRLDYTLNERYQVARNPINTGGVVSVYRSYLSPLSDRKVESIAAGDLVRVRLTVSFPAGTRYVVVEDRIPAGLEPLNERLNTTAYDGYYDPYNYDLRYHTWGTLGYNYKEIRDDRVSFFITSFGNRTRIIEYTVRATHDGTFTALPAEAWAMYEPETWGRSSSDEIRIGD